MDGWREPHTGLKTTKASGTGWSRKNRCSQDKENQTPTSIIPIPKKCAITKNKVKTRVGVGRVVNLGYGVVLAEKNVQRRPPLQGRFPLLGSGSEWLSESMKTHLGIVSSEKLNILLAWDANHTHGDAEWF